jgi:hypothetical protein
MTPPPAPAGSRRTDTALSPAAPPAARAAGDRHPRYRLAPRQWAAVGPSAVLAAALALTAPAAAATLVLLPSADATVYEESTATAATANGSGEFLLAGRNNQAANSRRRSLLRFDLSALPAGATITSVSLQLHLSTVSTADTPLSLHRVLTHWSEGPTDPAGNESAGLPASTGDVTWSSAHHPDSTWFSAGGDFLPAASATVTVGTTTGFHTWSEAGLIDDLAAWATAPATNFGWILRDPESSPQTAKRFASREHPDPLVQPRLTIEFTPIPEPSTTGLLAAAAGLVLRRRKPRDNGFSLPFRPSRGASRTVGCGVPRLRGLTDRPLGPLQPLRPEKLRR